jgi:lactoylglutathione lyase
MKKLSLAITLCLFIIYPGYSQNTPFDFTFNHIALSVKDLNASVEFYKKVFQLPEITNRTANPNIRWVSLHEGKELHLISNAEPVKLNKSVHLALTINDLEAFQKHLSQLKIPYSDWAGNANTVTTRADGVKQIYVQDPDGYWIEINNASE